MPFANNGAYTAASGATSASPGAVISSSVWNAVFTDFQSAMTTLGQGCPYTIGSSGVIVNHTGNTNETVLATIPIPAGALGANGIIRATATWSFTNNANNKSLIMRLGGLAGTAFIALPQTVQQSARIILTVTNRNSASSQVGDNAGFTGALVTSAINTAVAQDFVINGQLANGADTISLIAYTVEIFRRP